jgi:hypothetical protein
VLDTVTRKLSVSLCAFFDTPLHYSDLFFASCHAARAENDGDAIESHSVGSRSSGLVQSHMLTADETSLFCVEGLWNVAAYFLYQMDGVGLSKQPFTSNMLAVMHI